MRKKARKMGSKAIKIMWIICAAISPSFGDPIA